MLQSILLALLGLASSTCASPPLSISLETGWAAPPLFLEIIETVHDEDPSAYLPLLRILNSANTLDMTSEKTLESAIQLISTHQLLPELSTFHLALALHTTIPRIEAAYSWYSSNVDEAGLGVEDCASWVEWSGKGFCDPESLKQSMETTVDRDTATPKGRFLPFDRVSRRANGNQAILYFTPELSTTQSSSLIAALDDHAESDATFSFIIRYRPSVNRDQAIKSKMTGYGVELALKKTDYLVVDDRDTGSGSSSDSLPQSSNASLGSGTFEEILGSDPWAELSTPLSKLEVMDLGLKASALIMSAQNPLDALRELSQDFPKYSAALSRRVPIPNEIAHKAEIMARRGADPLAVYINGKSYSHPELNAYTLLKAIRAETKLATSLVSLGLTPKQSFQLLSDPIIGQRQTAEEPGEGVVDASDRAEGGGVIVWWNDIEKDSRYKQWPSSLTGYLRPTYPGQLHTVRKNTWNVVMVLDLSLSSSLETVTDQIAHMIQRGIPIRFGVVPMFDASNNDISLQMAKLYMYSVKTFGRGQTSQMLSELAAMTPGTATGPGVVKLPLVQNAYERLQAASTKDSLPFEEVIGSRVMSETLQKVSSYQNRLLATKLESPIGHLFINGKYHTFATHWTSLVQNELTSQIAFLQEQLQSGYSISDVSNFFYDLPGVPTRRSKIIVPTTGQHALKTVNLPDLFASEIHERLFGNFVYPNDPTQATPVTMWVIGDLDSAEGLHLVKNALRHLQSEHCSTRLGFIHVPLAGVQGPAGFSTTLHQLVSLSALAGFYSGDLLKLVEHLESHTTEAELEPPQGNGAQNPLEILKGSGAEGIISSDWEEDHEVSYSAFVDAGTEIARELGINGNQPHLLVNGRLVGPLSADTFAAEDFAPLETYEYRKRVKPVLDLLKTMYDDISTFDRATLADHAAGISSILTIAYKSDEGDSIFIAPPTPRSRYYETLDKGPMSFHVGDLDNAIVRIAAVIDPISEEAQVWSTLLKTASEMDNMSVSVYLEPDTQNTEIKLKRFYRASCPTALKFDDAGEQAETGVTFNNLPSDPIYTLALDTPPAWIVSPLSSPYDLDNLQLSSVTSPIHVSFQLKQLLIEGHARELSNSPPRGLQLQLTRNGIEVSDTLVMANLGYLQFKVTPGVYDLSIRPGRGSDVFELQSTGTTGWYSDTIDVTGTEVTLASLEGMTILPRFTRKEGMEVADVLAEINPSGSGHVGAVWSRMKELVGLPSTPSAVVKSKHADINIFTVASGLLYERFASIMILSVMKHTQSSVKFWFIENFLSPTFLAFIPHLAEEYGFEYELVTYKWPHWLRAQTEKQRIIWAYKILFLDVLFPMDLDKVIFVDADQIVRTDMKELVDLDLQNHVYGYPPMGDDRHEMEGFRFWKTGYWKDALRGRPYHISALYVVDLKRFRQLATGDRLRGQYHALSADPNSLANLDQDLPNSMQDQIPIFTLDQDWLWCQTWCSDESLKTAKTIDLCQNPLTKEPKLARARQIPEWDVYDQEVAAFAKKIGGSAGKGLAGSVDALAGAAEQTRSDEHDASSEDGQSRRLEDEL